MNKVEQALERARYLLNSVGLSDWSVSTNRSCKDIAVAQFHLNNVMFSDRYISIASKEDFDKITFHEIAHIKAGYGSGHGDKFVEVCRELCPDKPFDTYCISAPIQRYKLVCYNCGDIVYSNKKENKWCKECAANGVGVYKMSISVNKLKVMEWASTQ